MALPQRKIIHSHEAVPAPRRRVLKTVKKQERPRARIDDSVRFKNAVRIFSIGVLFCVATALSLLVLYRNIKMVEMTNEISAGEQTLVSLRADRDYLITQVEPYRATERIERLARINLGMEYPSADRVFRVDSALASGGKKEHVVVFKQRNEKQNTTTLAGARDE
jgi:hypothetical protein